MTDAPHHPPASHDDRVPRARFTVIVLGLSAAVLFSTSAWPDEGARAAAATDDDQAILDLSLPPGAELTLDGVSLGERTQVAVPNLPADGGRTCKVRVSVPGRPVEERTVLVRRGWRVPLAFGVSPSRRVPLLPTGHGGPVKSIVFNPGGDRFVTSSDDDTAVLWDVSRGEKRSLLEGHGGPITAMAFSPNGRDLVTGARDGTTALWNAATGHFRRELPRGAATAIRALAFSADSRRVSAGTSLGAIVLWDLDAPRIDKKPVVLGSQKGAIAAIAFRGDGTIVSTTADPRMAAWGLKAPQPDLILLYPAAPVGTANQAQRAVLSSALSSNARRLVTGSRDRTATVWDLTSGRELTVFREHAGWVTATAFSHDGTLVLTGSHDRTAILWDARTSKKRHVLTHSEQVTAVVIDPTNRWLITGTHDGAVHLWDAATGKPGSVFPGQLRRRLSAVAVSPDNRWLATGGDDGAVSFWDGRTGKVPFVRREHGGKVNALAFSRDGRWAASASDDWCALLWNLENGTRHQNFGDRHRGPVTAVAFSPDSRWLATGSEDRSVVVWDVATGQAAVRPYTDYPAEVTAVVFSPDGRQILTGTRAGEVAIRNPRAREQLAQSNESKSAVASAIFSADERTAVTVHVDRTASLWGLPGLSRLQSVQGRPAGQVVASALSADGRWAVAGAADGRVTLWDTQTGESLLSLTGLRSPLRSACFSPDARRLLTATADGAARLWDLATGDELVSLHHLTQGTDWLVTTPSGLFDGSADGWRAVLYQAQDAGDPIRLNEHITDYRQPGLLAKVLAGEPLPAPKFAIDRPAR